MVVNRYANHVLCIFNCMLQHYINTMYCYKTFYYKRYTIYKYILFITTLTYRITPRHAITLTVKCPNMENKIFCKFWSNIKDICILNTIQICFNTTKITIKLSCSAASTQIDIVIQRYLRKLRKKSAVKHVHIERNTTLNIEPFQLFLIAVLSNRCHDSDLV